MQHSDSVFSALVQGYWRLEQWGMDTQALHRFTKQHIEFGVTTVDHAAIYGQDSACERMFGAMLRLDPRLREQMQIVTKCGIYRGQGQYVNHYNFSADAITHSVNNSLRNLHTEQLDVLLLHRPDILLNADEVADTFIKLKAAGKVKHFGVSNFTPAQFELLQSRWHEPLITNQVEINPVNLTVTEDGTLEQMQRLGVRPMAWSCLAGGRLFTEQTAQMLRLRHTLNQISEEIGATNLEQVVFAWVMKMPAKPVPIIGSGNIERVQSAVAATALNMTAEQWYRIWVASKGHNVA